MAISHGHIVALPYHVEEVFMSMATTGSTAPFVGLFGTTFGVINLSIVRGRPQVLDLKQTIEAFILHRKDVVQRRTRYELAAAQKRAHILEGLLIAVDNIDEVVQIIRSSPAPAEARSALCERFELSEEQAQAIHI